MQKGRADMGVRWTCIHVLMHVHILIKVWDQKQDDWDTHTHTGTPRFSCKLFKLDEGDMRSQVDMYTCTDACTNFNQVVGPQAW